MARAPVGDDVFRDDPTVLALEHEVALRLGKESGLFVPSGTMANQLALRSLTRPGDEVLLHHRAHIFNYESGAGAALAGVSLRTFDTADGTLPPEAVAGALHLSDDPHFAPTTLVCFENTNNGCGGRIVPEDNVRAVVDAVRPHGIRMHLDGARLFNAAVGSGREPAELAAPFDTTSVCLSKGLGAPVGSVLTGDRDIIAAAYRFRKMYGGAMRQAGYLAAAGLYAIAHHVDRLADDHRRAKHLASELAALPAVEVDVDGVHTNLVYFDLDPDHPLASWGDDWTPGLVTSLAERGVAITGSPTRLRAVTHLDVDDDDIERALAAFRDALSRNPKPDRSTR